MRPILTWGEESEGVKIRNGVIGSVVGWRLVGDGVALALVVAVPVCVDGVGLAGFAKVDLLAHSRSRQAKTQTKKECRRLSILLSFSIGSARFNIDLVR